MALTEKDITRIVIIALILLTATVAFFVVKPVLLSVIAGLVLAYIFHPVYRFLLKYVKYRDIAASLITILVLAIIFVPLWFLASTVVEEVFGLFQSSQGFDSTVILSKLFPSAPQLVAQASLALNNAIGKISSFVLNAIIDFLVNSVVVALHLFLVAFVFYFALRDSAELKKFAAELSPLQKNKELQVVKQFEDITKSLIYGQIIIGIIQGLLAGFGLWIFGVPKVFTLTLLAIVLSILPVIGPGLLYIPVAFYLNVYGNPFFALGYLLYNLLIVSTIDNVLRAFIVSKRAKVSQVIVLIGMIGGLLVFGIMGILIGPLVLAYFITILRAYKDKTLSGFFAHTN